MTDLATLDADISSFDRIDLLSAVAGLQLLAENAERVVRLEALAFRVACGQSNRSRKVAPHTLRKLCTSPALGTIAHAEDPFDNVFCAVFKRLSNTTGRRNWARIAAKHGRRRSPMRDISTSGFYLVGEAIASPRSRQSLSSNGFGRSNMRTEAKPRLETS